METQIKENIELKYLSMDDYDELKETMLLSYETMPDAYWTENQIRSLIEKFPEGQVIITIDGEKFRVG